MTKQLIFSGLALLTLLCGVSGSALADPKEIFRAGVNMPSLPVKVVSTQIREKTITSSNHTVNYPVRNRSPHKSRRINTVLKKQETKEFDPISTVVEKHTTNPTVLGKKDATPKSKDEAHHKHFNAKLITKVTPGVNEIVRVSIGHLNRLITPFSFAVIETTSTAAIQSKGASVYINSKSEAPVTMFIHEKGEDDPAISLTLLPTAIPPRQVQLVFNEEQGVFPAAAAKKWERSLPFEEGIKSAMTDMAKGLIPQGYGYRKYDTSTDPLIECANQRQGISLVSKQIMKGHSITYIVSKVQNISHSPIEVNEMFCYHRGVLGVAFWPRLLLKRGESTELYVAVKNRVRRKTRTRPTVLSVSH